MKSLNNNYEYSGTVTGILKMYGDTKKFTLYYNPAQSNQDKRAIYINSTISTQADFKSNLQSLYNSGKPISEIVKEYDLTRSAFTRWIKQYNNSGSFKEADNRTEEEKELIRLKKENQQLRMENDILKQAALIMGRK